MLALDTFEPWDIYISTTAHARATTSSGSCASTSAAKRRS